MRASVTKTVLISAAVSAANPQYFNSLCRKYPRNMDLASHRALFSQLDRQRNFLHALRCRSRSPPRWRGVFKKVFAIDWRVQLSVTVSLDFNSEDFRPTVTIRDPVFDVNIDADHWDEITAYIRQLDVTVCSEKTIATQEVHVVEIAGEFLVRIRTVKKSHEVVHLKPEAMQELLGLTDTIEEYLCLARRRQRCLLDYYVTLIEEMRDTLRADLPMHRVSAYATLFELLERDVVQLSHVDLQDLHEEIPFGTVYEDLCAAGLWPKKQTSYDYYS